MLIKAGVDISMLNKEIRRTLRWVNAWVEGLNGELVVMSTYEGNHMASSLHYCNDAYDIRKPERADAASGTELRRMVGMNFDVIMKDGIIHIEYDPDARRFAKK